MKKLVLILGLMVTGLSANAQNGAKIEFKEEILDFGKFNIDSGFKSGVFEFKNTGNQPLYIKNINSTCKCFNFEYPTYAILPGEIKQIELEYDIEFACQPNGKFFVSTNAINKEEGIIVLKIIGKVLEK